MHTRQSNLRENKSTIHEQISNCKNEDFKPFVPRDAGLWDTWSQLRVAARASPKSWR